MFKEYSHFSELALLLLALLLSIIIYIMLMNVLIFQNYAHRHPIIVELFSLTPTYYSQNNAGTSGSCLLVSDMYVRSYITFATYLLSLTQYQVIIKIKHYN